MYAFKVGGNEIIDVITHIHMHSYVHMYVYLLNAGLSMLKCACIGKCAAINELTY